MPFLAAPAGRLHGRKQELYGSLPATYRERGAWFQREDAPMFYPMVPIERSLDGQIFHPMSPLDVQALFADLERLGLSMSYRRRICEAVEKGETYDLGPELAALGHEDCAAWIRSSFDDAVDFTRLRSMLAHGVSQ